MVDELKRIIINQCSPVLMGCKPSALFMLNSREAVRCLSALLPKGLKLSILRETEEKLLILLYRETMIEKIAANDSARLFLGELGYPADFSGVSLLEHLKRRFACGAFPHEVGVFLGYPIEDVQGFIEHKGKAYKFCGYWKVYGDVEKAKLRFSQYDLCRKCMKNHVFRGLKRNGRLLRYG